MRGVWLCLLVLVGLVAFYAPIASAELPSTSVEVATLGHHVTVVAPCACVTVDRVPVAKACSPAQCKPDQTKCAVPDQIKAKPDQAKNAAIKPDQVKGAGHRKGFFRALLCPCCR